MPAIRQKFFKVLSFQDVIKVCVLLIICIIGFSVSIWTITKQSKTFAEKAEKDHKNISVTLDYPELFKSYFTTLKTLTWSTFGLIEPENISISYDERASDFLQVGYMR